MSARVDLYTFLVVAQLIGKLIDKNLILVQSPGLSCWGDVILYHKENDSLVPYTARQLPQNDSCRSR